MSSKNRKRLLRKIIVNNEEFFWSVTDFNCDGDFGCNFQIWKNKIKIFEELTWTTITPKIVREKILNIIDMKNKNQFDTSTVWQRILELKAEYFETLESWTQEKTFVKLDRLKLIELIFKELNIDFLIKKST